MQPDKLITLLLKNRGLTTLAEIESFFHPPHPNDISLLDLTLNLDSVSRACDLIRSHITAGHPVAVYGDYDVDGICATAVIWEALYSHYPHVLPHIPHRKTEGYGLTEKGIDHCLSQGAKLIITVDNGIVAHTQVDYCRSKGCDIIVIDHHEPLATLPAANVLLHTTAVCATALSWFFSRQYLSTVDKRLTLNDQLSLVALATICDLIPLLGVNRSLAKYGLEALNHTTRPGLLALYDLAGLTTNNNQRLTSYHAGFIIGPRLNAMGRLEHALDSLRLLCTTDTSRARQLATTLTQTNRFRQDMTADSYTHAQTLVDENDLPNLIVVADTSYDEGIIGLIAGKLLEKYHRPTVAIAIGESVSKGSARSFPGFNITDHLRTYSDLLLSIGGHAGASGFSLNNQSLDKFISAISHPQIDPKLFKSTRRIDATIPLDIIDLDLILRLNQFEPFGLGNPQPVFTTLNIRINDFRSVGKTGQHLKFKADGLDAIWFNAPLSTAHLALGPVDLIYQVNKNTYNGYTTPQLIIQDITPHAPPA